MESATSREFFDGLPNIMFSKELTMDIYKHPTSNLKCIFNNFAK